MPDYKHLKKDYKHLRSRSRSDYPFMLEYRTRWSDNDMYGHLNNSVYNLLYDSLINAYLIRHCGLDLKLSSHKGLMAHSSVHYFASVSFPACVELGLRVIRLGTSSVAYEVALFEQGVDPVCSVGEFVHVFVESATGKTAPGGMLPSLRRGLEHILIEPRSKI